MTGSQAISRADGRSTHGLVLIVCTVVTTFVPAFHIWPLLWLVPLLGYAALVAIVPSLRATIHPWRFGRVSRATVLATAIISIVSCAVLLAFHLGARPDVRAYGNFLPLSVFGSVLVAGVLFSVFNALFEEVIFRGILFDAVQAQWGGLVAIIATAFLFGYGHKNGYPPGPLGAVLSGVYGIALGWLRVFCGGIGLPILAHITADAVIFTIIARAVSLCEVQLSFGRFCCLD